MVNFFIMCIHKSVLLKEVLDYLECSDGKIYVDGTIGEGGHAEQILIKSSPTGRLVGIDLDEQILKTCAGRLDRFGSRVQLVRNNFKNIKAILNELGLSKIDGFLVDLGISSFHLQTRERGFSFQKDAPLDMRLDQRNVLTAALLIRQSSEEDLARIIWEYGEERWSRRISRAICYHRQKGSISTTGQLAEIVKSAIPAGSRPPTKFRSRKIHPATRTFQALRIAVNQELEGLDQAIKDAVDFLRPGARICVISFHSLEDRIVKRCLRKLARPLYADNPWGLPDAEGLPGAGAERDPEAGEGVRVKLLTTKPVIPTEEEIRDNPRSRSAKLRVAEKCQPETETAGSRKSRKLRRLEAEAAGS